MKGKIVAVSLAIIGLMLMSSINTVAWTTEPSYAIYNFESGSYDGLTISANDKGTKSYELEVIETDNSFDETYGDYVLSLEHNFDGLNDGDYYQIKITTEPIKKETVWEIIWDYKYSNPIDDAGRPIDYHIYISDGTYGTNGRVNVAHVQIHMWALPYKYLVQVADNTGTLQQVGWIGWDTSGTHNGFEPKGNWTHFSINYNQESDFMLIEYSQEDGYSEEFEIGNIKLYESGINDNYNLNNIFRFKIVEEDQGVSNHYFDNLAFYDISASDIVNDTLFPKEEIKTDGKTNDSLKDTRNAVLDNYLIISTLTMTGGAVAIFKSEGYDWKEKLVSRMGMIGIGVTAVGLFILIFGLGII